MNSHNFAEESQGSDLIKVCKSTFHLGIASVAEVADSTGFPTGKVRYLWSLSRDICLLDKQAGYAVHRTTKLNPALRRIYKALSVTPACPVQDLHAGLMKTALFKGRQLPIPMLECFCKLMGLTVSGGNVLSPELLRPEDVLASIELELASVLRDNNGLAHHSQFERHFVQARKNIAAFETIMSITPILLKVEHRVWRQVGFFPTEDQIVSLKTAMGPLTPPSDVSDRIQALPDEVMVTIPIYKRSLDRGLGHIPQKCRALLQGSYRLHHNGTEIAHIRVNGPEVSGLQQAHRMVSRGAKSLRIAFNVAQRTARLVKRTNLFQGIDQCAVDGARSDIQEVVHLCPAPS